MGKLISTHTGARWAPPRPSSSKARAARRRLVALAAGMDGISGDLDTGLGRTTLTGHASARPVPKRKKT